MSVKLIFVVTSYQSPQLQCEYSGSEKGGIYIGAQFKPNFPKVNTIQAAGLCPPDLKVGVLAFPDFSKGGKVTGV